MVLGPRALDEIGQMNSVKTVQGQEVRIDAYKWWHLHMNPKINDANITSTDIVTDNGMIHVLNRVLMPNMELTCPVCRMGFMNIEAMNAHTKTGHVVEKAPEPMPPAEVIPAVEMSATAKVTEGVFEILFDAAGKFRFHLKAANGQIIAVSQSYLTRQSAEKGIASVKKNAPMAKVLDHTTAGI